MWRPARVPCVSNLVVHSLLYVQTQLANETAAVTHQHNVICVIECAPSDCFTERFYGSCWCSCRTLLSRSSGIVFAQMCILLYDWANNMMMMMMMITRTALLLLVADLSNCCVYNVSLGRGYGVRPSRLYKLERD